MNSKNSVPCRDNDLKKLCSEYSDTLPCCDAVAPGNNRFRDRGKILWGKSDCLDLFEFKEELLKAEHFRFKTVSWCMFPVLKKGDILKVKTTCPEDIKIGDIPTYRKGDKLYAHRIVDKQIIDGKQVIITRPDSSRDFGNSKNGEKVSEEDILGKIEEVKRGRKIFSTKRRKATNRDKFLYKKAVISFRLAASFKKNLETILIKFQTFSFYKIIGKKLATRITPNLNFELLIPFSYNKLNQLYNHIPLKDDKKIDFSKVKEAKIFHLVMKFKNTPMGCVSFLNRPEKCPCKDLCISDFYIRLRYRKLGFDSILLKRLKEILKINV